jgi:hypothetical protein
MAIRAARPGPGTNGLGSARHERAHGPCCAVRRATSSAQIRAHRPIVSYRAGPVRHGDFVMPVRLEAELPSTQGGAAAPANSRTSSQ